jgi:uncharacterized protein YjbJ (UPF0337 family)
MTERPSELKGNLKQAYGKLRHDPQLEAAGADEAAEAKAERKLEGAIEEMVGNVEEYLGATAVNPVVTTDGEARRIRGAAKRAR